MRGLGPACIAIPTQSAIKPLRRLVGCLVEDPEAGAVLILDNGHTGAEARRWFRDVQHQHAHVRVVDARGWGIHHMWNVGWDWARAHGFEFYGAFNDDITVPDRLVTELAAALRADRRLWIVSPDWQRRLADGVDVNGSVRRVIGTQRHDGIAGWCWLARTDIPVHVDEQFEWWYGDCDLAEQIRLAGGGLGIVEGLPLDHDQESTARHHPWTRDAIVRDGARYEAKHGPGTAIPLRVSVLMPTKDRSRRLSRAVRHVLAQDYPDFELIVKNGGVPVNLPDHPRLRVLDGPDTSIANALNQAAAAATGDVLHVAMDDDEMQPGALASGAHACRFAEWTYGWMRTFEEQRRRRRELLVGGEPWPWDLEAHKVANCINQPTAFFTRAVFDKHGPFNEDFPMVWDYEWWMRLGTRYTPTVRDHCDAHYVIWSGSTSVHSEETVQREVQELQDLWARVGYGER